MLKESLPPQLTAVNDSRVYKIFNIILVIVIVLVIAIALFLLTIQAYLPVMICTIEVVVFSALLLLHIKGYHIVSRYIFFVIAILAEIYGSLYHGENGGFDFYLLVTAIVPVLFFYKKYQYYSLFILSIGGYILVKLLYSQVTPLLPFYDKFLLPYYANIVLAMGMIFVTYSLFKLEHLKYEKELNSQKEEINLQNERLTMLKNQLEAHLETRNRKVQEQDGSIKQFAFLNAHKARGPLARVMGLINLTELEDLSIPETREFYLKELNSNVKALDEVLAEISQTLYNGDKA